MANSTICSQDPAWICSLAVNMNNTDEASSWTRNLFTWVKKAKDSSWTENNANYIVQNPRARSCKKSTKNQPRKSTSFEQGLRPSLTVGKLKSQHLFYNTPPQQKNGLPFSRLGVQRLRWLRHCPAHHLGRLHLRAIRTAPGYRKDPRQLPGRVGRIQNAVHQRQLDGHDPVWPVQGMELQDPEAPQGPGSPEKHAVHSLDGYASFPLLQRRLDPRRERECRRQRHLHGPSEEPAGVRSGYGRSPVLRGDRRRPPTRPPVPVSPGQRGRPLRESGIQRVSVVILRKATSLYGYKLKSTAYTVTNFIPKPIWLQDLSWP